MILQTLLKRLATNGLIGLGAFLCTNASWAEECSPQSKWTGYSYVRKIQSGKAHFYTKPQSCSSAPCPQRRKAYLVPDDFVVTGSTSGDFICSLFRGKSVIAGWIHKSELETPKSGAIQRGDLNGIWLQMPCGAGDDCMLELTVKSSGPIEVNLMDHLHDHPGGSFDVSSVKETPGVITVVGAELGSQNTTLKISYSSGDLPPGMIRIEGDDHWYSGLYYKARR